VTTDFRLNTIVLTVIDKRHFFRVQACIAEEQNVTCENRPREVLFRFMIDCPFAWRQSGEARQSRGMDKDARQQISIITPGPSPALSVLPVRMQGSLRFFRFYTQAVSLELHGRICGGRGALLNRGRCHHELLLIQLGDGPDPLQGRRIGLHLTIWEVGEA
jgi:hypothetical protein